MKKGLIMALLVAGLILAGCTTSEVKPKETPTKPVETPTKKPEKTPTPKVTPIPTPTPKPTPKIETAPIKCTICHTKAPNYSPHANGGKLCGNCHGWDPHKIHVGAGTINLDCRTCHGEPPNIVVPQPMEEGRTVCENCHAYPDPLKPSYGNLINIHIPRGKYCTNCHGTDVASLHATADKFAQG